MATLAPRVIVVRRETEMDRVRAVHSSAASARFVLKRKRISLDAVEAAHADFFHVLREVHAAIPGDWRHATILRSDVERFVFGPEDIIVAVGQDGLVANVAKYLDGQPVIGVDPAPGVNSGALVRFRAADVGRLLKLAATRELPVEHRTMAEARLDDGVTLTALNEIFVGHRSHQSARYTLVAGGRGERQSSSGLIVATGTGATGWARSIMQASHIALDLAPTAPRLGYLVREAWPSPATGTEIVAGLVEAEPVVVTSEMDDGGTIFADGIESDHLLFGWGRQVSIGVSPRRLSLAVPA
jgi:NAD kinase